MLLMLVCGGPGSRRGVVSDIALPAGQALVSGDNDRANDQQTERPSLTPSSLQSPFWHKRAIGLAGP